MLAMLLGHLWQLPTFVGQFFSTFEPIFVGFEYYHIHNVGPTLVGKSNCQQLLGRLWRAISYKINFGTFAGSFALGLMIIRTSTYIGRYKYLPVGTFQDSPVSRYQSIELLSKFPSICSFVIYLDVNLRIRAYFSWCFHTYWTIRHEILRFSPNVAKKREISGMRKW